jgi:fatty acid-binding protein DegV
MERVRTSGRALARLSELAVSAAGAGAVDVTVHHLAALDRANVLADIIHGSLPRADVVVGEVGAAVGAHVGPGMVAVAVSPR